MTHSKRRHKREETVACAEQSPHLPDAHKARMCLRRSTCLRAHEPGHKHIAFCFSGHDNDGPGTSQSSRHMLSLLDHRAQSTMSLKPSDSSVSLRTRRMSRRDLPKRIGISDSQTTSANLPDTCLSRRAHADQQIPGNDGRKKGDASTDILANRVSAAKINVNILCCSHLSLDKNDLLGEMKIDSNVGILPELCRINNCGLIPRVCSPVCDYVLQGSGIHWRYNCALNRFKVVVIGIQERFQRAARAIVVHRNQHDLAFISSPLNQVRVHPSFEKLGQANGRAKAKLFFATAVKLSVFWDSLTLTGCRCWHGIPTNPEIACAFSVVCKRGTLRVNSH